MPTNGLSLLPEELRRKEEDAKQKAKEAMKAPSFEMHMPEKNINGGDSKAPTNVKEDWVKFGNGQEKKEEKKGIFQVRKKPPLPTPIPKIEPPKPKVNLWEKYCLPAKGLFKKLKSEYKNSDSMTEEYAWLVKSEYWLKWRMLLFVLFLLLIVFAAGRIGIRSYQIGLLEQYNDSVEKLNQANEKIIEFNKEKENISLLKNQLVRVDEVFTEHVYWSKLFSLLESSTIEGVSYIEFEALSEREILLTALSENYTDLANQIDIFDKAEFIESVDIDFASVHIDEETDEQEVRGIIDITLKAGVLNK